METPPLSPAELARLDDLDSRSFGFCALAAPEEQATLGLIGRGVERLETQLLGLRKAEAKSVEEEAAVLRKLGHLHLLLQDFPKALSAYQTAAKGASESWQDAPLYYGLGLVYHHFRAHRVAVEAFRHLLYVHPCWERSKETHLRLGLCYQGLERWDLALKHLRAALSAVKEGGPGKAETTLGTEEIKFHIGLCLDEKGDLRAAKGFYEELARAQGLPVPLKAAVFRQLGWLYYRGDFATQEPPAQRLETALAWLLESSKLEPASGKTYYYLGRCYSSMAGRAHEAFVNYRHSIDKSEASADTWCSIGVLYQQQQQPMDALQAFVCAVQLDPSHAAAWIDLALLYESVDQFPDALHCFRRAAAHRPPSPQALKARMELLASEVRKAPSLGARQQPKQALPSLEEAWKLPIPAELTQRQQSFLAQKQERYVKGASLLTPEPAPPFYLSQQQIQMMNILQQTPNLEASQVAILRNLQHSFGQMQAHMKLTAAAPQTPVTPHSAAMPFPAGRPGGHELPQIPTDDIDSVLGGGGGPSLMDTDPAPTHPLEKEPSVKERRAGSNSTDDFLGALGESSDDGGPPANDPMLSSTALLKPTDSSSNLTAVAKAGEEKEKATNLQDSCVTSSSGAERPADASGDGAALLQSISVSTSGEAPAATELLSPGGSLAPPPSLNLLAPLSLPISSSAKEILARAKGRTANPASYVPVFAERCPPPVPPERPAKRLPKEKLLLPTPVIVVDARKDATAPELQQHCYAAQAVLIRNLTSALRMDLGLFSTKTLMATAGSDEVEVRTQMRMPVEANVNAFGESAWHFESTKAFTTVAKYAHYQAQTFHHLLREEQEKLKAGKTTAKEERADADGPTWGRPPKARLISLEAHPGAGSPYVKFGTNIDLSDERKWAVQLEELRKLPGFLRLASPANLLTHLGHTVFGMNTLQLYMKVPGCRTPGHQENLNFASVNINIGPGECEWVAVPSEYWGELYRMCAKAGVDYLKGSWWPPLEELWDKDIPVYRFVQKPGDVVWVGSGCVHWVQATGWCNNIAYNVGAPTRQTMSMAVERYEFNKLHSYKSIVPLQHLAWQIARNIRLTDEGLFTIVKGVLARSLAYIQMTLDYAASKDKAVRVQGRSRGDPAPYCGVCEIEVFCVLFVREEAGGRYAVFCPDCARRAEPALTTFTVLQQFALEDLAALFDNTTLNPRRTNVIC